MSARPRPGALPAIVAAVGAAAGAVLLLVASAPPARAAVDQCQKCHAGQEGALADPARKYAADIHAARGITCAGCHGGNPDDADITAMDPDKGFKGAPARTAIVPLCASCHANAAFMKRYNPRPYIFSLDEFRTSVHGQRQAFDPKVANCTSCHSVHDIRAHTDPLSTVYPTNVPGTCAKCHNAGYLKGYGIPTNQYALYLGSVHGVALLKKGDLSAPACNDCHGNHGAVPPGVSEIAMVCGTCHGRESDLFTQSRMAAAMRKIPTARGCVTCHGEHGVQQPTDSMLSAARGGACFGCHPPGSAADQATSQIAGGLDTLKQRVATADSLLHQAELLGMDASLGREQLRGANDQLIGLRASLHSFDPGKILGVLRAGLGQADAANKLALEVLRDWRVRRLGLAASLIVILGLIFLLVRWVRSLDAESRSG